MKKQLIFLSIALLAAAPLCSAQTTKTESKGTKSASKETALMDLEKSAWETYKNKQADAFRKNLAANYYGVYSDGIKSLEAETADMAKTDLRDYSFTDTKVTFSGSDVATVTYKVTTQASFNGKDMSGTYNAASVWMKRGAKWLGVFHTEVKAE